MSFVYKYSFTSFNLDAFVSLSCLSALARTSNTAWTGTGESGCPCLVPHLLTKALIFFYHSLGLRPIIHSSYHLVILLHNILFFFFTVIEV